MGQIPQGVDPYIADGQFLYPLPTSLAPITPPSAGLLDSPTVAMVLNSEWASIIEGELEALTSEDRWAGDETAQYEATQAIQELLLQLSEASVKIGFTVRKNANQSGTPNTEIIQVYGLPIDNTGGGWDEATDDKFVAPVSGRYAFMASIQSTGLSSVRLLVNNALAYHGNPTNTNNAMIGVSLQLNAGDTVKVAAVSSSGVFGSTVFVNFFSGHLVYRT